MQRVANPSALMALRGAWGSPRHPAAAGRWSIEKPWCVSGSGRDLPEIARDLWRSTPPVGAPPPRASPDGRAWRQPQLRRSSAPRGGCLLVPATCKSRLFCCLGCDFANVSRKDLGRNRFADVLRFTILECTAKSCPVAISR